MVNKHRPALIVHIIHRLHIGGLENGLVNLINNTDEGEFNHVVICMTDYTDFRFRLKRDVPCYALHKARGQDFAVYIRVWWLLRKIKPDIVHTRNIGTLECIMPAVLAGVKARIHGEHGRVINDLDGKNRKHNFLRKIISPLTYTYIALSGDLASWLENTVGIAPEKVTQIYNGVDTKTFHPRSAGNDPSLRTDSGIGEIVIGTVGRMQPEKDPLSLANAFISLVDTNPVFMKKLRLHMIGGGVLYEEVRQTFDGAGCLDNVWLPGDCNNVPDLMRNMDVFVLPSLGEGISNTILEAMASGLPVIATNVGGNPELVIDGKTGMLIPAGNSKALTDAIGMYLQTPGLIAEHGAAGRERAISTFGLRNMVRCYTKVYEEALGK